MKDPIVVDVPLKDRNDHFYKNITNYQTVYDKYKEFANA